MDEDVVERTGRGKLDNTERRLDGPLAASDTLNADRCFKVDGDEDK
jgi:hypothetical protein